jgi:hypothetical protein
MKLLFVIIAVLLSYCLSHALPLEQRNEYTECKERTFKHPQRGVKKCMDYCAPHQTRTPGQITFCNNTCPGFKELCQQLLFPDILGSSTAYPSANTPRETSVRRTDIPTDTPIKSVLNIETQVTSTTVRSLSSANDQVDQYLTVLSSSTSDYVWLLLLIPVALLIVVLVVSYLIYRHRTRLHKPVQEVGPSTITEKGDANARLLDDASQA